MDTTLFESSIELTQETLSVPSTLVILVISIHLYDYLDECLDGDKIVITHHVLLKSFEDIIFADTVFCDGTIFIFFRIYNSIEAIAAIMHIAQTRIRKFHPYMVIFGIVIELAQEVVILGGRETLRDETRKRVDKEREFLSDLIRLEDEIKRIA